MNQTIKMLEKKMELLSQQKTDSLDELVAVTHAMVEVGLFLFAWKSKSDGDPPRPGIWIGLSLERRIFLLPTNLPRRKTRGS